MRTAFVIPGDLTLPTGGYAYDRRVLALLPSFGVGVQHVALPGTFPAPPDADLQTTARALAALPGDTVLLIDGLAYGAMPDAMIAAIRQPIVALCHHPLCLEAGLDATRQATLKSSEMAALARARHVIVTGPATARILAADFAVPPAKITIAEPGTDRATRATGRFISAASKRDGARSHTSGTAPPTLLAVGSIVPRKGYSVLIEALATLQDLDWLLTIVGAPRDRATVEQLARQIETNGLIERINCVGAVDDAVLAAFYDSADIFVMPSLFEGYGMVLAEAMARGLPIVCTTGGAAAETAPDAAALKVPPGDATAFATALRRVLTNDDLRVRMSDASWDAGQKLPQWTDTARIIAGVLKGIDR